MLVLNLTMNKQIVNTFCQGFGTESAQCPFRMVKLLRCLYKENLIISQIISKMSFDLC